MLTPNGQCAIQIEKVMLLAIWAFALNDELSEKLCDKKVIIAGIGKPTYPVNQQTIDSYLSYWEKINQKSKLWRERPENMSENPAVEYGDPHGDLEPRRIMAQVMSKWYGVDISPRHILFTVGGIAALRIIFETLNARFADYPGYRIITPFPHYSAYSNNSHVLHPIDVMKEVGYKLTAKCFEESILSAYLDAQSDHKWPKAVLLCNPSNPLGNYIDEAELIKIADILRKYSDLLIILDEAYVEMSFNPLPIFLKIAPDLKERVILMRSATKALSAAGERMAILIAFDPKLMSEMLNKNISYFVHAPRSSQIVYAETMANFDEHEQQKLVCYYKNKVNYIVERLALMGANMPDNKYKVEATFYVLCDLSDLYGLELPIDAERAVQRTGKVKIDEDIAYYLLFTDHIMLTPLSYFGLSPSLGYFRITCSGHSLELKELMNRIERRLYEARKIKNLMLLQETNGLVKEVKKSDVHLYETLIAKMPAFDFNKESCLSLKLKYQVLQEIHAISRQFLKLMK